MTPHEHMTKHLQKVTGGIAWERRIFTKATALESEELVDAAVDIAWARLMPNTLERPLLEIKKEGSKIVFRVKTFSLEQVLSDNKILEHRRHQSSLQDRLVSNMQHA